MALKLNWKNTQLQLQPATAVSFALACGSQRVVPDHIFPMNDGAGIAPVDVIDGATFDTPVGTVDQDYSFGAPAYGFFNGIDHVSRTALEISSASGGVSCSDEEFLNPDHSSFGIYLQYSIVEGDSGVTVSILRKGGDHVTPAVGDVTTQLHYDETTHRITLTLAYNSVAAGSFTVSAYVGGTVDDACRHWLYAKVNFTDETISVFGDTDVGTSTSIAAMIAAIEDAGERFENTTDLVEIGANSDLNANDNPVQIAYMAILRGASSDKFERSHGQTLWVHGKDQNIIDTGYEITYARTSRVAYPIAADKVAMWAGSAGGGDVQVPLEFNANWGGTDFLSLGCSPATENLAADANDLSAWTASSADVAAIKLISERGFREMDVVDATANGGYRYHDFTGLTALTTYRVSWYARAETGSHNARVEVTQNDLTTTLASLEPALTVTRGRYTFTFTTQAAQTQLRMKLFGGTAATQTNTGYHGIMLTEGTAYGPVIYNDINQDGTTETLAVQTQVLNVAGNELTNPDEGSVWAAYIQSVQDTGATRTIVDIASAASNVDRRYMYIAADGTQLAATYDGAGASYQLTTAHAALTADAEYNRSMKWRRKANLAAGAYTLEDDITAPGALTQTVGGTANTEGTGGHTRIYIACRQTGSGQLSGLQTLHLYPNEVRSFNIIPAVQTQTAVAYSAFTSDPTLAGGGGVTDHGSLSGLTGTDHHTQYVANTGTRFDAGQTLAHSAANDSTVLSISKIPAGAQSGSALALTMGANTTGAGLLITQDGSGAAISIASGVIQAPVGEVTKPTYAFNTGFGVSTGMYSSADHRIDFTVSGTNRVSIGATTVYLSFPSSTTVPKISVHVGTSGLGSPAADEVNIITNSLEAIYWDSAQNTHLRGGLYLGIGKRIYFDDNNDTYVYAVLDDYVRFFAGGNKVFEFSVGGTSTYGIDQVIHNDIKTAITGSGAYGYRALNLTAADATFTMQYSPQLAFHGEAWNTTSMTSKESQIIMQLRTVTGATTTAALHFRGSADDAVISDIGYITTAGWMSWAPDTDASFTFGRIRMDSITTDDAYFSHFDHATAANYALRHTSGGQTYLNGVNAIYWGINGTNKFQVTTSSFASYNADGPLMTVVGPTASTPSLVPNRNYTGSGVGAPTANEVSIITDSTEAVLWDASQNQINAADISVPQGSKVRLEGSAGGTYISAAVTNFLYLYTAGSARVTLSTSALTSLVPSNVQISSIGTSITGGNTLLNTSLAAVGAQQNSPALIMQGSGWETAVGSDQNVKLAQFVQPVQGTANPSLEYVFKGSIENVSAGAYTDIAKLSWDGTASSGQWQMPFGLQAAPTYAFSGDTTTGMWAAAGILAFSASGVYSLELRSTFIRPRVAIQTNYLGLEATPTYSFSGSGTGDGLWSPVATEVAISTGGTEAVRWDASQNTILAGDLSLNIGQKLLLDADGTANDYLYANADGSVWLYVDNAPTVRFLANAMNIYGSNAQYRDVDSAITGSASYGHRLIAQANATAGNPVKNSPTLEFEGQAWNTTLLAKEYAFVRMQLRMASGDPTSGKLYFRGSDGAASDADFGYLTPYGSLHLGDDTDQEFVLGKLRSDGRTAGTVNLSHYTKTGTTEYAVQIQSNGNMKLNSTSLITLATGGTGRFNILSTMLYSQTSAGPGLVNDAATATIPTVLPNHSDTTTGVGAASAGELSLITGGIEAVRWDASQNAFFAGMLTVPDGLPSAPALVGSVSNSGFYFESGQPAISYLGTKKVKVSGDVTFSAGVIADSGLIRNLGSSSRRWLGIYGGVLDIAPKAATSGALVDFTYTAPAHTNLTTLTEVPSVLFDMSADMQHATGNIASQSAMKLLAPTYSFVGASTITNADTLYIDAAPIAGTNATITYPAAMRIGSGAILLADDGGGGSDPSKAALGFASDTTRRAGLARNYVNGDIYLQAPAGDKLILGSGGVNLLQVTSSVVGVLKPGTENAPSFWLNSDSDTGWWWPAADTIAFSTGGIEAVRWDAAQKQINAAGIEANANADESFIFGRARIDARTTDIAHFSHYDQSTTTSYALRQTATGLTTLNSSSILHFAIAGSDAFVASSTYLSGLTIGSGKLLNEVSSATNPTLIPNGTAQGIGIGGSAGTVSIITSTGESARFNSDRTQTAMSHIQPNTDSTQDLGTTSVRWRNVYIDDLIATTSGTFGGDIDAAGGFRRTLDACYKLDPSASTEYTARRDGPAADVMGWHVCARAGSAVELSAWVEADVTAGQVDFWVQKSTNGGDTFSDWWGSAASPVVSLKAGASPEVVWQADSKDTNTFSAGDIMRIRLKPNASWAGGRYFFGQIVVEC